MGIGTLRQHHTTAAGGEDSSTTPSHRVSSRSAAGWYDVIGKDGRPVNERALRKQDAESLAEKLNG